MHNIKTNFDKIIDKIKPFAQNIVNQSGNVPRPGVKPKFSDLEVMALAITAEVLSIDSENLLFHKLQTEYKNDFPMIISRRQFNDRRKNLQEMINQIRHNIAMSIDSAENYFVVDSKPLPVCRFARARRCSMGKKDADLAPNYGYCAAQSQTYYGYKMHVTSGLSGVIHTFTISKASVADINYVKDLKYEILNCTVIGDRGYLSKEVQLDLFENANIRLEVPYRHNQKDFKPVFKPFAKARKRIETTFSQLCDQFMMTRNYAKNFAGFSMRILTKITAFTLLQLINYTQNKPISQTKYALI